MIPLDTANSYNRIRGGRRPCYFAHLTPPPCGVHETRGVMQNTGTPDSLKTIDEK